MTLDFNATTYYSQAHWYRRREDAASIANRFERYLDKLAGISPLLADMFVRVRKAGMPFETARPNLASLVQKTAERDEKGRMDAADGFAIGSRTRGKNTNFSLLGFVGRDYHSPDMNNIMLSTDSGFWPNQSLMTYPLFRATMLATIECWDPLLCVVQCSTLQPYMARGSWYRESWMTYVHPSLVHRVSPPEIPVVEPTPDGGLLLAATTETFDVDNPDHLEAARRICQATRHLDDVMPRIR